MSKTIFIDTSSKDETRTALTLDGNLDDFEIEPSNKSAVKGDIYLAQENKTEAYEAYVESISSMDADDPRKTLLEMKRDDVAVINES